VTAKQWHTHTVVVKCCRIVTSRHDAKGRRYRFEKRCRIAEILQLGEDQLKNLLEKVSEQSQKKTSVKVFYAPGPF